jgi:hypothetical protein
MTGLRKVEFISTAAVFLPYVSHSRNYRGLLAQPIKGSVNLEAGQPFHYAQQVRRVLTEQYCIVVSF